MHPPEPAGRLEGGEVAADGLHGDVEAPGEVGSVDPPGRAHQLCDLGLAFLCEHGFLPADGDGHLFAFL